MVDDRKSRAILIYVRQGSSPFPSADPDGVVRAFPEDGAELIAYAKDTLREMRLVPVDWSTETYKGAIERLRNEMARRHPELNEEAVDAIAWVFAFENR